MAVLAVQRPSLTDPATTLSLVAAGAAGDSFINTGIEFFHVLNSHATVSRTVTFDSPGTCNFGLAANAAHDMAMVVPGVSGAPANRVIIGPFPTGRFNDAGGSVQVTYSAAGADLTVAVQE